MSTNQENAHMLGCSNNLWSVILNMYLSFLFIVIVGINKIQTDYKIIGIFVTYNVPLRKFIVYL